MKELFKKNYFSYAKINLGLKILNKKEDGYHNIHSLFIEINLADQLFFTSSSNYRLTADGSASINLPLDDENLISKAYRLVKQKARFIKSEYSIHIKKEIPMGSGLGGGSSNAAITLKALNDLWNLNMQMNELITLSQSLGADVPFFIQGGMQLVEGIGDILSPVDNSTIKDLIFVLVNPQINISTSWAYELLNKSLQSNKSHLKFAPLPKTMDWELFENDFERVINKTYPEIGNIKAIFYELGALFSGLSGSGSTVFGVFDNLQRAESTLDEFNQYQTFLTSPVLY